MITAAVLKNVFEMKYPKANVTVFTVNNPVDDTIMLNDMEGYLVISDDTTYYYVLATYYDSALANIHRYLIDRDVHFTESSLTWRLSSYLSMLIDNNNISTNIKLLEDISR